MRIPSVTLLAILSGGCDVASRVIDAGPGPEDDAPVAQCDPNAGTTTCNENAVVQCNPDGTFGPVLAECGTGMACSDATCVETCTADGVDLVYVVTNALDLLSFDPRKLPNDPFTRIGGLDCPHTRPTLMNPPTPVRPFSMAIDREGLAWVEYTSGEVFNVSITTAACTASGYIPEANGMKLFGMGFSTDAAAAHTERLFIAGGGNNAQPGGNLAHVDTHGAQYTPVIVGPIAEVSDFSAELTGTNEGKLFGFFPKLTTPAFIHEIDKTTGALIGTQYNLGANGLGAVTGWAFAQWGGKFYVFVTSNDNSTVRVIDRASSAYSIPLSLLPYTIVGAGVSTCAPIL